MNAKLKTLSMFGLAGGLLTLAVAMAGTPQPNKQPRPEPNPRLDPVTTLGNEGETPRVQIALLLDTSGSMDGLIEQAKSQMWKIVNQFSESKRNGQRPKLEIALFEYGNDNLSSAEGWIRMVTPFTSDLDALSEKLFALRTNGGTELAGQAIQVATNRLDWSGKDGDLKLVFIAGNEDFNQGSINPANTIAAAARKGIIVNTIFCGNEGSGIASGWRSGAVLAHGSYMTIDHNVQVAHIDAPQDAEIAKLSLELNETYIPFGRHGASGSSRQQAQDKNAKAVKQGAFLSRAVSKASAYYDNSGWDLVDAFKNDKVDVGEVEEAQLPPAMKGMNAEERKAYVEQQSSRRANIQAKIKTLNNDRTKFVTTERAKAGEAGGQTLDVALLNVVKSQASKKGYEFE